MTGAAADGARQFAALAGPRDHRRSRSPKRRTASRPRSPPTLERSARSHLSWNAGADGATVAEHNVRQDRRALQVRERRPRPASPQPSALHRSRRRRASYHYYCDAPPRSSNGRHDQGPHRSSGPARFGKTASSFGVQWSPRGPNKADRQRASTCATSVGGGSLEDLEERHGERPWRSFGKRSDGPVRVEPRHTYEIAGALGEAARTSSQDERLVAGGSSVQTLRLRLAVLAQGAGARPAAAARRPRAGPCALAVAAVEQPAPTPAPPRRACRS